MANHDHLSLSRRGFLQASALGLVGLGVGSMLSRFAFAQGATPAPVAGRPPNIIFILADDLGIADVSCYGSDRFRTPSIDALARLGTRFQTCYSTPLCGPSRCQCLTGRYPFRTGLNTNRSQNAVGPAREVMTPTILQNAGYATACVGKWGQICLGPGEWGFADYLSFKGSGQYWADQRGRGKAGLSYSVNGTQHQLGTNEYLPDLMHRYLVDYIQQHRDTPFFVHYSMSHIHGPILRTPDSRPGENSQAVLYSDNITYMDKLVGELITALERMKLRERTLILFTGDNGTARFGIDAATIGGQHIFGQKGQLNEGGCRVPLVVNWPGVAPEGAVNHDLVDFSDFLPTFAELAGAATPAKLRIDGQSFAAQVRGQKGTPREWVYCELSGRAFVRDSRYKLTSSGELLDLCDAPFAEIPVATPMPDEAKAAAKRLQAVLDGHQPAPGPNPQQRQQQRQQRRQRQA